jgi:hypothetical protein
MAKAKLTLPQAQRQAAKAVLSLRDRANKVLYPKAKEVKKP